MIPGPETSDINQTAADDPNTANQSAYGEITEENIDPAFVYSIDTDRSGTRGLGIVARFTHDPETKQWQPDGPGRKRFYVFQPGKQYQEFTMPMDAAIGANIKREHRTGPAEQAKLEQYMAEHYQTVRS